MNKTILIIIGVLAAIGIIVAAVAAAVVFYFVPTSVQTTMNSVSQVIETSVPATPEKSLGEYLAPENLAKSLYKPATKTSEEMGLIEQARFQMECPSEGPCSSWLIVSKEPVREGTQEFYLVEVGGAGSSYYGPFTDNLSIMIEQSNALMVPLSETKTLIQYSNANRGISVKLPYYESWNTKYRPVSKYDENGDSVNFGSKFRFEGGEFVRQYALTFRKAQTADSLIKEIKQTIDKQLLIEEPTEQKINGLSIVRYTDSGLCEYPTMTVIGQKYNYEFRPTCSVALEKDFTVFSDIIKTIKLID